jgi:hypothetical protein
MIDIPIIAAGFERIVYRNGHLTPVGVFRNREQCIPTGEVFIIRRFKASDTDVIRR